MAPEVPLEHTQEDMSERAREASERWILGVALTAALFAVIAAITALLAEEHVTEAILEQDRATDQWGFYQGKGNKLATLRTKMAVLTALGKKSSPEDEATESRYVKEEKEIRQIAERHEELSEQHMAGHRPLSRALTLFQVGIAVAAISVLTRRKAFWLVSIGFGAVGTVFLAGGILMR